MGSRPGLHRCRLSPVQQGRRALLPLLREGPIQSSILRTTGDRAKRDRPVSAFGRLQKLPRVGRDQRFFIGTLYKSEGHGNSGPAARCLKDGPNLWLTALVLSEHSATPQKNSRPLPDRTYAFGKIGEALGTGLDGLLLKRFLFLLLRRWHV